MKAKYFSAEDRVAAEAMARTYFPHAGYDIVVESAEGDAGEPPRLFLAISGTPAETRNADAGFGVYYEGDGVYLELYDARGVGAELDTAAMSRHLGRKNISGVDARAMQALLAERCGRAKIAPAQKEHIYGEEIIVEVAKDEMTARAWLLAPEPGAAELGFDEAVKKTSEAGVSHGLDEKALQVLLDAKEYGEPYVIARAAMPVDGVDGKIVFHFSTDERTGRPREIGGGRVDYRSLDLYEPVTEGQLLVSRTPATEGAPGTTVTGKPLKFKPGKDARLPKGKNIEVNEDMTEIHAKCSGMVAFVKNSINVSSVYKINGDCDLSIGNIDFDGSVHISGNVRSGHVIKASGGVTVGGSVEAATIIAGGNVEVKGGMQGADKGRIEAGGSITILFIERGTAIADGSISFDVSIHSVLEAGGTLSAKGRRGAIIGGRAGAAGNVTVNYLGAVSRTQTEVEVGVMPRKRARIHALEKEIEKLKGDLVKLDQLDTYLAASSDRLEPETWDKLFRSGAENRRTDLLLLEEYGEEMADIKFELEHATESKVHVLDTVFEGTKIIIGNGVFKVSNDIQYASFRYKDAEVVYGPCELSK